MYKRPEHHKEKRELIQIWKSVKGNRDWAHYILGMNAANSRYISKKAEIYAEAFFTVPLQEYLSLCKIYFNNAKSKIYYESNYKKL